MKPILLTYYKHLSLEKVQFVNRYSKYKSIVILTQNNKLSEQQANRFKKVEIIEVNSLKGVSRQITRIYKERNPKVKIFPHFEGDAKSKFAIQAYNKLYGLKINPNLFKLKNWMNNFLADVSNKVSSRYTFDQLMDISYDELCEVLGDHFILKPVNADSSILSFKITSEEDFLKVQKKIKKKYKYILEKYIYGNLYAVDFFFDGSEVFVLCHTREITFSELIEKFSTKHKQKYQHIYDDYLYYLPIRYNLDFNHISTLEKRFIRSIGSKLKEVGYRGFIHLEYKINRKTKDIGFIEWGARPGGKRSDFIKKMFNITTFNLPYDLLYKKDRGDFKKEKGLYFLRNRNIDNNIVGIKTTVIEKTHLLSILDKSDDYLSISYDTHIREFLKKNWKIRVKNISYSVRCSKDKFIYPFYLRSDTAFNYYIDLDELNYKRFLKNKSKIVEHLVFHDYSLD